MTPTTPPRTYTAAELADLPDRGAILIACALCALSGAFMGGLIVWLVA